MGNEEFLEFVRYFRAQDLHWDEMNDQVYRQNSLLVLGSTREPLTGFPFTPPLSFLSLPAWSYQLPLPLLWGNGSLVVCGA